MLLHQAAFQVIIQRVQRGKMLSWMMAWREHYLMTVDSTGTFAPCRLHGSRCLRPRHRDGSTSYTRQQLCAAMVHPGNAGELVRAARSRWKTENETFNTLKNIQNLEHNFGHGSQHLSNLFVMLTLLAFQIDQPVELAYPATRQLFAKFHSRTAVWKQLHNSFCGVAFRNWQELYGHALGIYATRIVHDTS